MPNEIAESSCDCFDILEAMKPNPSLLLIRLGRTTGVALDDEDVHLHSTRA